MIAAPTVAFVPCCEPGESIIFMDTVPLLSTNLVDGAVYRYLGGPATGQGQGPLGLDSLVSGQCYTLVFGVSPSIYPILPSSIVYTIFASTGNSCLDQACVAACGVSPVEPSNNRYLQYVPCCVDSGPTLYFRVPSINVPIDGVASYVGTINSNPYPTTDINCNPTTSLVSNKCYSITVHSTGVGQPVSTVTQYNCLAVAPQNISGNYIYHSPVYPAQPNSSCQTYISACPDCNPLCFTLWSCDGSQPLFTTSTDLTAFIGIHITVSSVDIKDNIVDLCVFVQESTQFDCTNAIEIEVKSNSCICDCTCYTVTGNLKSIEYIDCSGNYVLIPNLGISTSSFCSQTYPIVFAGDGTTPTIITNNGACFESTIINPQTSEEVTEYVCTPPACYLLEDCTDNTNFIYSNSPSLALPANLGQVVTILGHTECWKILISEECICPINVTVLTTSSSCLTCFPVINYKLTLCSDSTKFSYTSDDLSQYVDKVIRKEECPDDCWIVSKINGNIPSDSPVVIIDDYLDCELCNRKYYRLQDCLGIELDIQTYTNLSDYVGKVITLDWCPETCWEVSETTGYTNAGIISNVLNSYTECETCLTSAPCICSTIKNYNDIPQTYYYLDCQGILQNLTLQSGQKSDRLCLIRWYAPKDCESFIFKFIDGNGSINYNLFSNNGFLINAPNYLNGKPAFYSPLLNGYIYYDGKKWILSSYNSYEDTYILLATLNCGADCNCPIGEWTNISSLSNQGSYTTIEFKYTIEYFGNCTNGVCPPVKNKQKSITPGYNTPGCEAWKYEEISCRAAEAMYKQVLQLRYGISNCCPEEDERYIIQKELIDLAALNDPTYPCSTNSCGCSNDCECSTAEPVCPPIPLTYNCFCTHVGCECIERGDGSGEYSTLALCQTACVVTSWNCVDCECVSVSGSGGTYPTEIDCLESTCSQLFITTWETTTADETIVLPYYETGVYSGTIDWGDDISSVNSFATSTHIYTTPGIYTVTICGVVNGWNFQLYANSALNIKSVVQWGQLQVGEDTGGYFYGCSNLDLSSVQGTLDLTGITNLNFIFALCNFITTINGINSWITSAIETMNYMFYGCTNFNQQLTFDTSFVNSMHAMFQECENFNQSLTFDTTNVTTMSNMFLNCYIFNSPLIFSSTGLVTNMSVMFANCSAFDQPLIWDTVSVIDMNTMFLGAAAFNSALTFTSTANVKYMSNMFNGAIAFNQNISSWNTSEVLSMVNMFLNAFAFQQNIGSWDISSVYAFNNFMFGKTPATWPTTYFDNLLCGWSPQIVQPGLTINFGTANYTNATGGPCYTILDTAPNNWTILSGGGV